MLLHVLTIAISANPEPDLVPHHLSIDYTFLISISKWSQRLPMAGSNLRRILAANHELTEVVVVYEVFVFVVGEVFFEALAHDQRTSWTKEKIPSTTHAKIFLL